MSDRAIWRPTLKLVVAGGWALMVACSGNSPSAPAMIDGKLPPCPSTPNCVCSETMEMSCSVEPLKFLPDQRNQAWAAARTAVIELGGTVETFDERYVWATFRSRIFRFVDDLQLRLDTERNVIQVRSASRIGYSDRGVNRKRVEALRSRFTQLLDETSRP